MAELPSEYVSWCWCEKRIDIGCTMGYEREIGLLVNIVLKLRGPRGDIWCMWEGMIF